MFGLSISRLLSVFSVIVVLGLMSALAIQGYALYTLKVDGPLYQRIEAQKDFIADMLPPPLFVVEAYAAAYEANLHPDRRADAIKRIEGLHKDFEARRQVWVQADMPSEELKVLNEGLVRTADAFWTILATKVMPVIGSDPAVAQPALRELADAYARQRAASVQLVGMATGLLVENEDLAASQSAWLGTLAIGGGSVAILIFIAGIIYLRFNAIAPLAEITRFMGQLAKGHYTNPVPYTQRRDEIGKIAEALGAFRAAGLAKLELENDAEISSAQRRQDRALRDAENERHAAEVRQVVSELGAGLTRLADCDIRQTIDSPFAQDFEEIRAHFNAFVATFQVTLEQVLLGTLGIREGSRELNDAAEHMAMRTERQAASLEETAAALEQISGTIHSLTANTTTTRQLVSDARKRADGSSCIVGEAVRAMQRIESSAREIGQIIGVIDDIAFQTNLLALNAGVEAARAGESGRGFAVVALEVRELAQRSAGAARQIKELVGNSAMQVSAGVKLVGETGRALSEISDFVAQIDMNVGNIITSIEEQATGILQTTHAVNDIDSATQQNAAMAQEAFSLSKTLADQAYLLTEQVEKFRLNDRQDRSPASTVRSEQRRVA